MQRVLVLLYAWYVTVFNFTLPVSHNSMVIGTGGQHNKLSH